MSMDGRGKLKMFGCMNDFVSSELIVMRELCNYC